MRPVWGAKLFKHLQRANFRESAIHVVGSLPARRTPQQAQLWRNRDLAFSMAAAATARGIPNLGHLK